MVENRKLATIMALDMAGYSRAAELDDNDAAAQVRALRSTIEAVVQNAGGRLFNSAGDGFMLEFPTATSGLEAGLDILTRCSEPAQSLPRVRIGLHAGEVIVEPNGDLLGHGVNIAARLQQLAQPATLVASEDVRRSVRGDLAQVLEPMGTVKLGKMRERLDIYCLSVEKVTPSIGAIYRRRPKAFIAGAATLALAALAFTGVQIFPQFAAEQTRFAIAAVAAPADDAELVALSQAMGAEIVNTTTLQALNTAPLQADIIEANAEALRVAAESGARYALFSALRRYGDAVHLDVRLFSTDGAMIWSRTFDEENNRLSTLPVVVSVRVASVLSCLESAGHRPRSTPQDALTMLANLCGADSFENPIEHYQAMQRALERAPNSPPILSAYAFMAAFAIEADDARFDATARSDAIDAARKAISLDPRQPYAYAALEALEGFGVRWRERERWLQRGLRHSPNSAVLLWTYGALLRETGRFEEAHNNFARALAIEPWQENASANLVWTLGLLGRSGDARAELERIEPMWPDIGRFRYERLRLELFSGDEARARRAYTLYAEGRSAEQMRCWRFMLEAIYPATQAQQAASARDVEACAERGGSLPMVIQTLAHIGEVERAFPLVDDYLESEQFWPGILFVPATASLRRDGRFAQIVEDIGIMDYWRASGWPDFCSEPNLAIECGAE